VHVIKDVLPCGLIMQGLWWS